MSLKCPKEFAKEPCVSAEYGGQSDLGCVLSVLC